jgi:nucleoside-diphosphate-sugar epimerase
MKILVTGGIGFLGEACVRLLRQANHEVLTTDRRGTPDIVADLADPSAADRLPAVDTVVHCAAVQYLSPDLPLLARRRYFHRNNVVVTRNLVHRYSGTGAHFINVGSSMMYEQKAGRIYGAASPWRGQGLYTASKIAAHAYVDRMPDPVACVIPTIIAGEGRGGLFASLVGTMRRWNLAIRPGPGRHKTHLVHVQDAAALIATVVERRATGRFNAGSAEPLSIVEWIQEISAALHFERVKQLAIPLEPLALASALSGYRLLAREQVLMLRLPHVLSLDDSLALGWRPKYTNAEIVRETATALFHK